MSIGLTYSGNIDKFKDACRMANEILSSEKFFQMIASREQAYEESKPADLSPKIIANLFRESDLQLELKHYKRRPSVGGAFDPDYPNTIWVNVNTSRSGCAYASVLVHECVHALSFHTPQYNFSHDGDRPTVNQNTAPYAIQSETRKVFCNEGFQASEDLAIVENKVSREDIV